MSAPGRWGSVVTAMVTPFDAGGALDVDGCVRLARWLADHGSDAFVLAGTTGESPVLSDDEKATLWRTVSEAVTVPVIAGSTSNDTAHSIELTKLAASCGVAAILVVTPYYSRPSQTGLDAHFRAIADASNLPVMLYDIPVRTGRKIATETIISLARDVPSIVALKDAAADPLATARLIAEAPDGFEVYSGDDGLTLPFLSVGAVGVVSVASHWAGERIADMIGSFMKGDVDGAQAHNAALLESWSFLSGDLTPNPVPTKAALRVLGLPAGECRLPMGPAPAGLEERAEAVLRGLGIAPGSARG